MNRTSVTLLIALETVLLIAVIVYGVFANTLGDRQVNSKAPEPSPPSGSEQMGDTQTTQSGSSGDTQVEVAYKEERLTFSDEVEAKLEAMTVEEKVAQMFFITPEALTGVDQVTISGNTTKTSFDTWPVGGLIYGAGNFQGEIQTASLLSRVQEYSRERMGVPLFLAVAEEGGAENSPLAVANGYSVTPSPGELMAVGQADVVMEAANTRAAYLKQVGFNMVLGPMGDLARGADTEFDRRTYGADADKAGAFVAAEVSVMEDQGILTAVKYFPWKSSRGESRGLRELLMSDLAVYQNAANAGADFIVVSNGTAECITGSDTTPCCLCEKTVAVLRGNMGYDGILMTDSLAESNIAEQYSSAEAAVAALEAGMDMVYDPADFQEAYNAVVQAAGDGTLSMVHIDNAVGRILTEKYTLDE